MEAGLQQLRTRLFGPPVKKIVGGSAAVTTPTGADAPGIVRSVTLTLTALNVAITGANDYGSALLCDLPDSNIYVLGVEVDLELTKGGISTGLEAATDLTVGLGSAAASNATLSGAMIDRQEVTVLTTTDATPAWQDHSADNATLAVPYVIADGATNKIYLNAAATLTVDDAFTATGTVTITYIDLGNTAS